MLPMGGVQSLLRELDPTYQNLDFACCNLKKKKKILHAVSKIKIP